MAKQIVAAARDNGLNHFDTAYIYGTWFDGKPVAEEMLGEALQSVRDQIALGTKGCQRLGEGPNA